METVRNQIHAFLDREQNPVPKELQINMALQYLRDYLVSGGKPYLANGVPVLLLPDGKLKTLTLENQEIADLIQAAGLPPTWRKQVGDVLMTGNLPTVTLHGISYYDEAEHTLYLNEWGGTYLRIDGRGEVTRCKNGDAGILFAVDGQPHETDLQALKTGCALAWQDSDALIEHVLGVGVFSDSTGLQRHHALNVLLAWLLSVLLKDRVRTVPIPFLAGPSGSRKTSIAQGIGNVITPEGLKFRVVACPNNAKDTENVIINAHGIVALDEFQKAQELASLLKAVTTGAEIRRRILFTTAKEQIFHVDAVPFLTVNDDVWADEATQKRLLRIVMGQPGEETGGWRGDYFVWRDWREKRIREKAWTELVGRMAAVMRFLEQACRAGRDDVRVYHRMSGFWSFILAIAEQEGDSVLQGMQETMRAVDETQTLATELGDELLEMLAEMLEHRTEMRGKWLKAAELREHLNMRANLLPRISQNLASAIQSGFALHRRLNSNSVYGQRLGFKQREQHHQREYRFDFDVKGDV